MTTAPFKTWGVVLCFMAACSSSEIDPFEPCGPNGECPLRFSCLADSRCHPITVTQIDAAVPDAAVPDAALPDASVPDAPSPDATPPDGGGGDSCTRIIPATPVGTVSNLSGIWTAAPFPTLNLTTVVDGYAQSGGNRIRLTDYTSACGHETSSSPKIGGKAFGINIFSGEALQVKTYTAQIYAGTEQPSPQGPAGFCQVTGLGDGFPAMGSVTITAIDATHVAGSFNFTSNSQAFSGSFDVPICVSPPAVPLCCGP